MCTFVITVERNAPLPFSLHVGPHPELQEKKEEARQRAQEIHHSKVGVGVLIVRSGVLPVGTRLPTQKGRGRLVQLQFAIDGILVTWLNTT